MSNSLIVFHFEEGKSAFEDLAMAGDVRTWQETDLMQALGYQEKRNFRNAVTRAMQACLSLSIQTEENFILQGDNYRFTRFACYLIAMNGDSKKPQVAAAQAYFAAIADTFNDKLEHAENIDRVLIREEMTSGTKALDSTAKRHGVENYAFFLNKGYRGMYNMDLRTLMNFKGLKSNAKFLDHIGKTELAANLYRVTQTNEKIKNRNIRGQRALEETAHSVGRMVRESMLAISGTAPEHLPPARNIQEVKKTLKNTSKKFKALDSPNKKPAPRKKKTDTP